MFTAIFRSTAKWLWMISLLATSALFAHSSHAFINALELTIETGEDDLRGGSDNVNAIVLLRNRERLRFDNINKGERWGNDSEHTVTLRLSRTTDTNITNPNDIVGLLFETTFGGGVDGDNWELQRLTVTPTEYIFNDSGGITNRLEPYFERELSGNRPLWRFRKNAQLYRANWSDMGYSHVRLQIRVGDDDLRQDNHLNVRIMYRGGEQYFPQINDNDNRRSTAENWENDSFHTIWLPLDRVTMVGDVIGVTLETSSRGGFDGDNFNMDYVHIGFAALLASSLHVCFEHTGAPLKRFTGDDWSYEVPCR